VSLLTPRDPARSLGVASLAVDGVPSKRLAEHLRKQRGILVQDKAGRHSPFRNALRVAPQVHTTPQELDRFVAAVREAARDGVPAAR
jgi:selenocysteine lyase/cysteine desulfurase